MKKLFKTKLNIAYTFNLVDVQICNQHILFYKKKNQKYVHYAAQLHAMNLELRCAVYKTHR